QKEPILSSWLNHPVSELSRHSTDCCDTAERYFVSTYVAHARPHSRDRWSDSLLILLEDFKWGWSPWPMYWCQLKDREHLDCGALAALARAILRELGVTNYPVQILQRLPDVEIEHFKKLWEKQGGQQTWLGKQYAYHELCLIESGEGRQA